MTANGNDGEAGNDRRSREYFSREKTPGLALPRLVVAVALVGWLTGAATPAVDAARPAAYDWCYNDCGSEAPCERECEADGGGVTTCGAYDGGAANGWCDGDTCDNICSWASAPEWECLSGGEPVTCEDIESYAICGDGQCAFHFGLENCDTCPQDCGLCPPIVCGNSICEFGETFRTCPQDCDDPGEWCGDGICSASETTACPDCEDPDEFCDGVNHFCPSGNQCVANWCSLDDVQARQVCQWNSDCAVDYDCEEMVNVMTNEPIKVCVRRRH